MIDKEKIYFIIIVISLCIYFYFIKKKTYNINILEYGEKDIKKTYNINILEYGENDIEKKLDLCIKRRIPTLIKNGLKYFPELQKWNEEYIYKKYGNKKCSVAKDGKRVEKHFNDKNMNYKNYFEKNKNLYLFSRESYDNLSREAYDCLFSHLKSYKKKKVNTFIDDLTFPNPFFNKEDIHHNIFYTGPKSSGILPHYHGDVFNLMIYGKKKWILFDSNKITQKINKFYEKKYKKNILWKNWYKNEYKYLISKTNVIEFIQNPNDIVFVPRGYLHTVYNNKDTMGILIEKIEKYT